MNKFVENIYAHSPIIVQDLFCSMYGLKLYRERYTGEWQRYYNDLLRSQYASVDELNHNNINLLRKILIHSVQHVPFYRNNLNVSKGEIEDASLDILKEIPILEKSVFREHANDFISTLYQKKKLIKINTSGTTGTPLTLYISSDARRMNYAFFARSKNWAGLTGFNNSITLAGRTVVSVDQDAPPFWRRNLFFNNVLFSSYHLNEKNLRYYAEEMRKLRPVFIDSYPSSIYVLAQYLIENNINDIKLQAVITSSETLLTHQREAIEKAFSCKVFDQYGSAEQAVFICQCEKGRYHLNPEYGYLEILDKNNEPVKCGELGEFVVTGFTNDAMPFIRYRIGDMGIMTDKKCSCGRNFPVIERIAGRNDDILITPGGRYIGRLDPIFKGMSNSIKETQIVQEKVDLIRILIVRTDKYKEEDGKHVVEELKKRMGPSITYKIVYVDEIARTSSGKFRAVICRIPK